MNQITRPFHEHRRVFRALMFLAALTLPGCAAYRTVSGDAVYTDSQVRIRFAPPRALVVHGPNGDSMSVADVVEIRGRVIDRREGMLTLEATSARSMDARSSQKFGSGAVVRVPLQEVELREVRAGRTLLLVAGLLGVVLVVAAATAEDPPPPPPKEEVSKGY